MSSAEQSRLRSVAEVLIFAALYTCVARLGLMMDAVAGFATLVWPATGLALAVLVRMGPLLWPGVALGALAVNLWTGAPPLVAAGIAVGNTCEALLGAWAVRRFSGLRDAPARLSQAVALVVLAAICSTSVSASIGTLCLWAGNVIGRAQVFETARAWWLGDAIGALVVAPLLMAWTVKGARFEWRTRTIELCALVVGLVAVSILLFGNRSTESAFVQVYMIFPVLIWAAMRFGRRGATGATLLVSAVAIWTTAHGYGPFVHARLATSLLFLQAFIGIIATTTLLLAVAIVERNQAVRSRDWFLAAVSHDLRNPLTASKLSTVALAKSVAADNTLAHKHVALLGRTIDRMTGLVRDLVDLAAIESGQFSVQRSVANVHDIIDEALQTLQPALRARGQTLLVANSAHVEVACDRSRVLQALANLIDNASKFSPENGTITLRGDSPPGLVRFSISRMRAKESPRRTWRTSSIRSGKAPGAPTKAPASASVSRS